MRNDNTIGYTWALLAAVVIIMGLLTSCELTISKANASENVDLSIIAEIESNNDPKAYNKRSGAIGLCQITAPVLQDFNRIMKLNYKVKDLYDGQTNLMIADWYMNYEIPHLLKYYKIKDNTRNRLIAYNYGIGHLVRKDRLLKETEDYIKKYKKLGGV